MATSTGGANPQAEGKVRDVVAEKVGKGILKDCNIDYTPTEYSNTYVKSKLDDVIKELEIIKNDI